MPVKEKYPPIETPDETVRALFVVYGEFLIDFQEQLEGYPGWQAYIRRTYEQMDKIFGANS